MNNKIETLSELKTKWRLEKYSSLFIIYSFIGWIIEVTWILFFFKKFVNSGFLSLPLIPIYGFGAVLISMMFKEKDNIVLIALGGGLIATILELVSSYLLEFIFVRNFWSYSEFKYNFDGRISLITSLLFCIGSVLIVKILNPIIETKMRRYKYKSKLEVIIIIVLTLIIIDLIYNSYIILKK